MCVQIHKATLTSYLWKNLSKYEICEFSIEFDLIMEEVYLYVMWHPDLGASLNGILDRNYWGLLWNY